MEEIYYNEDYKAWWAKFDHNPKGNMHTIKGGLGAIDVVLKHCKEFNVCVQAGGHLGFWANRLSLFFAHTYSFEADPIVFECLVRNIKKKKKVTALCYALGNEEKKVKLRRGASAGGSRVEEGGKIEIEQVRLDSCMTLSSCDAIMLDIEGGELNALKGAEETIKRFSPVILVEELEAYQEVLHGYMESIGYVRVDEYGRDGIWIRK